MRCGGFTYGWESHTARLVVGQNSFFFIREGPRRVIHFFTPRAGEQGLQHSSDAAKATARAFQCQAVLDWDFFRALDASEEGLRATAKEAVGIDPSLGFCHKLGLAELVKAWDRGKVQRKEKIDAGARAHGEPVTYLAADWGARDL